MTESRLTYDQFKADILRWKNSHREEYNRFARLMTNGDERQYLSICRAIFKQLPKVKAEWELCWGDDSVENFDSISLLFSEELHRPFVTRSNPFLAAKSKTMALSFPHRLY